MSQEGELSRLASLLLRAKLLPGDEETDELWELPQPRAGGAQRYLHLHTFNSDKLQITL